MGVKERKEKEKELRREKILKTGEKLFIKKGYGNTTMDEIARACELAKGTLYLYFPGKEDMIFTIIYRALTNLYELMFNYQKDINDPVERLRMVGKAYFEFYGKYPEHFRLLSDIHVPGKFHPAVDDSRRALIHEKVSDIWVLITKIVQDGIDAHVFRESTNPLEVSISLWSISTAMINMHDFSRSFSCNDDLLSRMPFIKFDFLNVININARRIIYSIMKNPPADFDSMK